MTSWTDQKIEQTLLELNKRAATDPDFRELALKDPNAAIEQIAGIQVPEFYKLKVIEADPDADQTILLPKPTSAALSEKDLDLVSGGCGNQMTNPPPMP